MEQIPNSPTVWIVLGVLAAVVIGFALWRRYNVVVRKGDTEVRFERQPESGTSGFSPGLTLSTVRAAYWARPVRALSACRRG